MGVRDLEDIVRDEMADENVVVVVLFWKVIMKCDVIYVSESQKRGYSWVSQRRSVGNVRKLKNAHNMPKTRQFTLENSTDKKLEWAKKKVGMTTF